MYVLAAVAGMYIVSNPHMFTGFVMRAIAGGKRFGVMRGQTFVVREGMCFIRLVTGGNLEETLFSPESHSHQPGHVKCGARCGNRANQPQSPATRYDARGRRSPQYFVLRPEPTKRNNSTDRQPARNKCPISIGHVLFQAAHPSHILFVVHSMDHAAGPKEHQGLEKRVRHHVENADRKSADPTGKKHKPKLRNGGVRQYLFYIVLSNANCSGE